MKSEQGLTRTKNNLPQNTSTPSEREVKIAEKLLDINLLVGFKLDGAEIVTMAKELDRLMSVEDMKKLPFILDCFKKEDLEWDQKVGIQNFFRALKKVRVTEDGNYKLLKAIW